jgi:hypothetical protein
MSRLGGRLKPVFEVCAGARELRAECGVITAAWCLLLRTAGHRLTVNLENEIVICQLRDKRG